MQFRKAVMKDLDAMMHIVREAQAYFKNQRINQWQNNYPNEEVIQKDIENGYSYVLAEDNQIIATVAVSFDGEKTYDSIYEGKWLSNEEYAVIHRIAVDSRQKGKGLSSHMLQQIEQLCLERGIASMKVDTHPDNQSMQRLLYKNEFQYCGIIYLLDGNQRIAFEKRLPNCNKAAERKEPVEL